MLLLFTRVTEFLYISIKLYHTYLDPNLNKIKRKIKEFRYIVIFRSEPKSDKKKN